MKHPAHTPPHSPAPTLVRGLPGLEPLVLRRWRSLSAAAPDLGIDQGHLYKIARGRMDPTATVIARIARALDVSADELLGLAPPTTDDAPAPSEK